MPVICILHLEGKVAAPFITPWVVGPVKSVIQAFDAAVRAANVCNQQKMGLKPSCPTHAELVWGSKRGVMLLRSVGFQPSLFRVLLPRGHGNLCCEPVLILSTNIYRRHLLGWFCPPKVNSTSISGHAMPPTTKPTQCTPSNLCYCQQQLKWEVDKK